MSLDEYLQDTNVVKEQRIKAKQIDAEKIRGPPSIVIYYDRDTNVDVRITKNNSSSILKTKISFNMWEQNEDTGQHIYGQVATETTYFAPEPSIEELLFNAACYTIHALSFQYYSEDTDSHNPLQ